MDASKDHALPAGTCTEQTLEGVLGSESEVSIPLRCSFCGQDGDGGVDCNKGSSSGRLVLRLRQVNGDGVLSGVGGDVWCAALLLGAWLLKAPEIVEGLAVLELGSGLGLCGVVAGYLAKSVTLTDYVDELVLNLEHNVKINCVPRVEAKRQPDEVLDTPTAGAEQQEDFGARRQLMLRPLSCARTRVCKLDWTDYEHDGARQRQEGDKEEGGEEGAMGWWWDDTGCRGKGRPADDDTERTATSPPEDEGDAYAAVLGCNVMIGSALIYSPHHACVADVLSRAFTEGVCRAAYIVQLSTRPGFDEFLHKLGSRGLCYRLQRMCDILSAELLERIRRNTPVTVVGGPVTTSLSSVSDVKDDSGGAGFDEFVLCSVFRAGREGI